MLVRFPLFSVTSPACLLLICFVNVRVCLTQLLLLSCMCFLIRQINSYFNMCISKFDASLAVVGLVCVLHNVIGYFVARQCMQVSSLHIKINLRFQGPIGLLFVA